MIFFQYRFFKIRQDVRNEPDREHQDPPSHLCVRQVLPAASEAERGRKLLQEPEGRQQQQQVLSDQDEEYWYLSFNGWGFPKNGIIFIFSPSAQSATCIAQNLLLLLLYYAKCNNLPDVVCSYVQATKM